MFLKRKGWLLKKNGLVCDGEGSTFVSNGIAEERAPGARRRQHDDEPCDLLRAYGSVIGIHESPAVRHDLTSPLRCASRIDCC